jgi:hypothetical protein
MKYLAILTAISFALAVISPVEAAPKGPSGGSGNSGNSGGSGNMNSGNMNKGNSGPGWNSGMGYGHPYYHNYYPGGPYVVERPIYENPAFSGLPIKIINPPANGVALNYALQGAPYTIAPGYSQDLVHDRSWVIEFSRGGNFGQARYGLEPGTYSFAHTDHGWDLYRVPAVQAAPEAAPSNPPPPAPSLPTNPAPKP